MLNTVKKSQSNNFINNSTSTSNLFAQRFPAKKEIAPFNNSQSQIPSNLQKIVSSLVYSCCNENIIRVTPSGKILPPHPVYAMPCGHNMCHKCITTILEKIPNPMISCTFLFIQAQTMTALNDTHQMRQKTCLLKII